MFYEDVVDTVERIRKACFALEHQIETAEPIEDWVIDTITVRTDKISFVVEFVNDDKPPRYASFKVYNDGRCVRL